MLAIGFTHLSVAFTFFHHSLLKQTCELHLSVTSTSSLSLTPDQLLSNKKTCSRKYADVYGETLGIPLRLNFS